MRPVYVTFVPEKGGRWWYPTQTRMPTVTWGCGRRTGTCKRYMVLHARVHQDARWVTASDGAQWVIVSGACCVGWQRMPDASWLALNPQNLNPCRAASASFAACMLGSGECGMGLAWGLQEKASSTLLGVPFLLRSWVPSLPLHVHTTRGKQVCTNNVVELGEAVAHSHSAAQGRAGSQAATATWRQHQQPSCQCGVEWVTHGCQITVYLEVGRVLVEL